MPFNRESSQCSFGSLPSNATVRSNNGIRVSTSATRAVSSLASDLVAEGLLTLGYSTATRYS